jgi:hypothetical protein
MRRHLTTRRAAPAARRVRAALSRRRETPHERTERRHQWARETFLDARDGLRAVLEDLIEDATRAVCPAATDVDVEVYTDELGEHRGRLIAVNTDTGTVPDDDEDEDDRIVELLDEWATTANTDSDNIYFRELPATPAATAAH